MMDDHQLCESCRFWDLQKNDNPDYMHRCTVSGSFRCEGGTLFTEPSFGCVHHSRRDT
jgi:hypothetical protein